MAKAYKNIDSLNWHPKFIETASYDTFKMKIDHWVDAGIIIDKPKETEIRKLFEKLTNKKVELKSTKDGSTT